MSERTKIDHADQAYKVGYWLDATGVLRQEEGLLAEMQAREKASHVIATLGIASDVLATTCYEESLVDAVNAGDPEGVNLLYGEGEGLDGITGVLSIASDGRATMRYEEMVA